MHPVRSPRALRLWGVRCALDTGVALALGMTTSDLEHRLRSATLAQIAAERGVPMPRLRQLAWAIAEPQLEAAVAAGAIDDRERLALHRRIDEKRGPWSDVTSSGRARLRRHPGGSALLSLSSSSSSSRPAHVLGGSEAGKLSSSSSSSLASSGGVRSSVTRTSRRTS
jgi:hypothetical protein